MPHSSAKFSNELSQLSHAQRRVEALHALELLDTPPDPNFDEIVELASQICGTPISLVSLVDAERQWFKAAIGLEARETPIGVSFCAHAIEQTGVFTVPDALKDDRFRLNALVTGAPHIRFYAGMPLYADEGVAVGTLCVIDTVPRCLTQGQSRALATLTSQVQARFELITERKNLLLALVKNHQLTATLEDQNQILSNANRQLELLATTDALTGLLNRRAFEARIAVELSVAARNQRPLSVIVLDVDNFKQCNDQYGHSAGDDVLRQVGATLRKSLRAGTCAGRIGGEEFAVILPEAAPDQAVAMGHRMQAELGAAGNGLFNITVSAGVACLNATATSWEAIFAQADAALYEAKRAGKNRVVQYAANIVNAQSTREERRRRF